MYSQGRYTGQENITKNRMLVLFNTLEEADKDMVISLSEYLAVKYKSNLMGLVNNMVQNTISDAMRDYIPLKTKGA